jgi:hypothetical protein
MGGGRQGGRGSERQQEVSIRVWAPAAVAASQLRTKHECAQPVSQHPGRMRRRSSKAAVSAAAAVQCRPAGRQAVQTQQVMQSIAGRPRRQHYSVRTAASSAQV